MITTKSKKLALMALALASLAGCQSSGVDYDALRMTSNQQPSPSGRQLGAGFIKGMTPEQTCIHFKDNFKTKDNLLCKSVSRQNLAGATIVNRDIDDSHISNQAIAAIAFFFDNESKLNYIQGITPEQIHEADNSFRRDFLKPSATKPRASGN